MKCSHPHCHRSANYIPFVPIRTLTDITPIFVVEISNHAVCNHHSANGTAEKRLTEHFDSKGTEEVVKICRKAFAFYKKQNYSFAALDESRLEIHFKKVTFH